MSKGTALWTVVKQGSLYAIVFPDQSAVVGGFETRDDAHTWISDHIIEYSRMTLQQAAYAREMAKDREAKRQRLGAALLMPEEETKH